MERQAFNRQPARAVLIDMQPPMDTGTCTNIKEALNSVLTLTSHLSGPNRLPLLSLSVIRSYTECVYPLQPVRGNYNRIQAALDELSSHARDIITCSLHGGGRIKTSLLDGLQEAIVQFNRYTQSLKQGSGATCAGPSQVEVTIITSQSPSAMRRSIGRIISHLDLQYLKKIVAICINDHDKPVQTDNDTNEEDHDGLEEGEHLSQQLQASPSELGISVLDVRSCDNDIHSLQMCLKSWLEDCSTDSEHLHILLPPPTSLADTVSTSVHVTIKCDLYERILHPYLLSTLAKHFILHTAGSSNITGPPGGQGNSLVPTLRLKAVEFVDCDGICESIIYGMPVVVKPTVCWKLDWEELERNQQYFQTLCSTMKTKNQAMVLASCPSADSTSSPIAHFILVPSSSNSSLLLKSIAVDELLLPVDEGSNLDDLEQQPSPPIEVLDIMSDSLSKLQTNECCNPLLMHSRVCEVIAHVTARNRKTNPANYTPYNKRGALIESGGRGKGRGRPHSELKENNKSPATTKRQLPQKSSGVSNIGRPKRLHIVKGSGYHHRPYSSSGDNVSN